MGGFLGKAVKTPSHFLLKLTQTFHVVPIILLEFFKVISYDKLLQLKFMSCTCSFIDFLYLGSNWPNLQIIATLTWHFLTISLPRRYGRTLFLILTLVILQRKTISLVQQKQFMNLLNSQINIYPTSLYNALNKQHHVDRDGDIVEGWYDWSANNIVPQFYAMLQRHPEDVYCIEVLVALPLCSFFSPEFKHQIPLFMSHAWN